MNSKQFLKSFIYFFSSLAIAIGTSYLLNKCTFYKTQNWHASIIFYSSVFLILNIVYNFKYSVQDITQLLLGSIVIKLLVAFIFILIYGILNKHTALFFSIHFIIHYLVFTVFEMYYLIKLIKEKTSKR